MADWKATEPSDSDIVSQYPANERSARAAVVTNFGVDHHEANDGDVGKHEVVQIIDNAGDPTIGSGEVGVWNDAGVLNTRVGAGAVHRVVNLPALTNMLFHQASAPTGWTQDTSVNDRVLRVVDGDGAGTGGSWTLSGVTVDGHALTVSQMPSHNHGGGGSTGSAGSHSHSASTGSAGSHNHSIKVADIAEGSPSDRVDSGPAEDSSQTRSDIINSAGAHTHSVSVSSAGTHTHTYSVTSQGGGSAHTHGLTSDAAWRPAYVDIIAATLD